MQDILLKRIKQLPPLPESALQIEAVYQNPDSSFKDMVAILEKDPLLTADILKAANSPLYGFSREIKAISQAVSLFGMGAIRGFALASVVKKSFALDLSPYNMTEKHFSELSKQQHALVVAWYKKSNPQLLGLLSPAAFLVGIGKVLIAQSLLSESKVENFKSLLTEKSVTEAENETYNTTTARVSATIFDQWKFDKNLIEVIKNCDNVQDTTIEDTNVLLSAQSLHVTRTLFSSKIIITDENIEAAKALITQYKLDMPSFELALETIKNSTSS
jgi:HD-like signal output (HDOD) protein